jgi:hypothetical protein
VSAQATSGTQRPASERHLKAGAQKNGDRSSDRVTDCLNQKISGLPLTFCGPS